MGLEIKTVIKNQYSFLHIKGEVDLYSSPKLRKTIFILIEKQVPAILVSLKNVTYMDTSGVATLIEGLQKCNKYKGRLVLVGLRENVKEVFELTRLDKLFEIYTMKKRMW